MVVNWLIREGMALGISRLTGIFVIRQKAYCMLLKNDLTVDNYIH
jgi:hypothetical protein